MYHSPAQSKCCSCAIWLFWRTDASGSNEVLVVGNMHVHDNFCLPPSLDPTSKAPPFSISMING